MLVRNLSIAAEAAGRADLMPLVGRAKRHLSTCTGVFSFPEFMVEDVSEIAGAAEWSAKRREKK